MKFVTGSTIAGTLQQSHVGVRVVIEKVIRVTLAVDHVGMKLTLLCKDNTGHFPEQCSIGTVLILTCIFK